MISLTIGLSSCSSDEFLPVEQSQEELVLSKNLSSADALSVANHFNAQRFGVKTGMPSRSDNAAQPIKNDNGETIAYVVNTNGAGWVIVSATTDYYPILAYSDDESSTLKLNGESMDSGFDIWLDDIKDAIKSSTSLDSVTIAEINLDWKQYTSASPTVVSSTPGLPGGNSAKAVACRNRMKVLNETYYTEGWKFYTLPNVTEFTIPNYVYQTADYYSSPYEYTIVGVKDISEYTNVGPFLTSSWSQGNRFNALCPNQSPAGCVAIAMAQIMYFHKFPVDKFDWNAMDDTYATTASQTLIADIGNTIGINYGTENSNANINDAQKGFQAYGYNTIIKDYNSSETAYELGTNKRPVYQRGDQGFLRSGHAWVCDGLIRNLAEYNYYVEYINSVNEYTNDGLNLIVNPGTTGGVSYTRFHMNWGWGGTANGWYINPTPTTKDGDFDFTTDRKNLFVSPIR